MKIPPHPPWNVSPKEAIALQKTLQKNVSQKNCAKRIRFVAGADIATYKGSVIGFAGIIVMTFPGLEIVERVAVRTRISFPYIPGLLAFREGPVLLEAFSKLNHIPDLILIDGQGLAHPRYFGIACHIGILLDMPTIGCAKSRLYGHHQDPAWRRGSVRRLYDHRGDVIGAVVRTRDHTRPIYVSVGHKTDLKTAIRYTLSCSPRYRIPEPTRQAHLFVGGLRQSAT